MNEQPIRTSMLMRLAEQAMSDAAFRAAAASDLAGALADAGYELNDAELELVLEFRSALRDAGVDVFLKEASFSDVRHLLEDLDVDGLSALADQLRASSEVDGASKG